MNICAFGKYRVDFKNNYTYISDKEFGEYTYSKDKVGWTRDINGEELMYLISNLLTDEYTTTISDVSEEVIMVKQFNPLDGTGSDISIRYEILPDSIRR